MDAARQDSKILVIVPGPGGGYVAVNIQKDAVQSSEALEDAVKQGDPVFLTYDEEFASQGWHKWSANKAAWNEAGLGQQWDDTNWKVYTTVLASVPLRHFSRVERLQIEDGGASAQSEHHDNAKVRKLE